MSKPRSLSLAAYRVLSWGSQDGQIQDHPARPDGELLWIHINSRNRLRAVDDFCRRLLPSRPGLMILLTAPPNATLGTWQGGLVPVERLPKEQTGAACSFLKHWQPDMGIWVGGGLMPNIITRANERGIPLVLLEAEVDLKIARGGRWLPDLTRYTFDCFKTIMVTSEKAARQVRRLGVPSSKVSVTPPLRVSPNPIPWPEDELIEITNTLAGRPMWLAAWVVDKEFISVLTAHRQALRILPRLILILHVADTSESAPLHKRLEAMDIRCANWDNGDPVEDTTQVVLSSAPDDLGLWHRLSPVSFMGSSLEVGAGGRDPLVATALGSAVIYGPYVQKHTDLYSRLNEAGAALSIKSATELAESVVKLLAPDRAADMALAGWQVVTEGAPLTDKLIDMVQDTLDQRSTENAGT